MLKRSLALLRFPAIWNGLPSRDGGTQIGSLLLICGDKGLRRGCPGVQVFIGRQRVALFWLVAISLQNDGTRVEGIVLFSVGCFSISG
jgi:hypothetical protein